MVTVLPATGTVSVPAAELKLGVPAGLDAAVDQVNKMPRGGHGNVVGARSGRQCDLAVLGEDFRYGSRRHWDGDRCCSDRRFFRPGGNVICHRSSAS